jgi:hypothetical protein
MSTVVRPSGPLPARVYWVRRLLLIAIVLLVILAVVRVLGGGGDPASGESATVEPDAELTDEPADPAADATPSAKSPSRFRDERPAPTVSRPCRPCRSGWSSPAGRAT